MMCVEQKGMESTQFVFVDNLQQGDSFHYNGKEYFAYKVLADWHVPCRRFHVLIAPENKNNNWIVMNVTEVIMIHQEK